MKNYGGNQLIENISQKDKQVIFSDGVYYYSLHRLSPQETLNIDMLEQYTVFLKEEDSNKKIKLVFESQEELYLSSQDAVNVISQPALIKNISSHSCCLLLAGVRTSGENLSPLVQLVRSEHIKKIYKPWGHELWINTMNSSYIIKEIFLKKGRKTSLQYHHHKQETIVLFSGKAHLWYKKNEGVSNAKMQDQDVGLLEIKAMTSADIQPGVVHRFEALSDIYLYEVSTSHPDDVIRLQDDAKRVDGKIDYEHNTQVCILTAGIGGRMGELSETINKALLPVDNKAVISWIIEKFPRNSKFVVALGYKGQQVKDYLLASYPDYHFHFVSVPNYDAPGSGPGHSLMQCRQALGEAPFYYTVCDAIYEGDIPHDMYRNWVGVKKVNYANSHYYCNFVVENQRVVEINNKVPYQSDHSKSFTGLCYLHEPKIFWETLEHTKTNRFSGEYEMIDGFKGMIENSSLESVDIDWTDVGLYQEFIERNKKTDSYNYSKIDEYLFFTNRQVIKFFKDPKFIQDRVRRFHIKPQVFPKINYVGEQFYSYCFVEGKTLYQVMNPGIFRHFLSWLEKNLWSQVHEPSLGEACFEFYRNKTLKRFHAYAEKYPNSVKEGMVTINDQEIPAVNDLLGQIPWKELSQDSKAVFIHGDLQFDNVIYTQEGSFKLIDWRQDFAGLLSCGDLYYDLAKLYGGILVNYDLIKENLFEYRERQGKIRFDFHVRYGMQELLKIYEDYIEANHWNLYKVKLLVGLIYLNMAPLHHYPYDKLLFALSAQVLNETLVKKQTLKKTLA